MADSVILQTLQKLKARLDALENELAAVKSELQEYRERSGVERPPAESTTQSPGERRRPAPRKRAAATNPAAERKPDPPAATHKGFCDEF
jgi:hypothetical protein